MPLLLIAGIFGGSIFLLTRQKRKREAEVSQNAVLEFGGIDAATFNNLPPFKQDQIKKFSAIASIAGSSATLLASTGLLGGTAAAGGIGATGAIAAAGPIGAAVAGAIIAIALLRGTAHLAANQWTDPKEGPQKKFEAALSQVVDAKDASVANGSATRYSLQFAREAVLRLWTQYKVYAEQFAANGQDYRTVITQSYETLNGANGAILRVPENERYGKNGFIDAVVAKIDVQLEAV